MTTLITGATGFIGGALLERLLADGRSVRALVRTPDDAQRMRALGVEPVQGDLSNGEVLGRASVGCDVVFHVAGLNKTCLRTRSALDQVNVEGTRTVVGAAARAGTRRIVFTSSAATIGEPRGSTGTESTVHRGSYNTAYERSKHQAERVAFEEAARLGIDLVAVNPSSVQGPGRTGGTARILTAYLRGRLRFAVDTRVSSVFIDDVVRAHLDAEAMGEPGERYIVSGWSATVKEAIEAFTDVTGVHRRVRFVPAWLLMALAGIVGGSYRVLGRDAPLCPEMVRALRFGHTYDGSRIEREWGFRYTPPAEWLRATVDWYRAQGLA